MNNNAITRKEAIETLYDLINSGILSEEIEGKIQDIADNIENEQYGLHMWGADEEEYAVLYTVKREDLITDEDRAEGQRIWEKYSFMPSPHEEEEIIKNLQEAIEETEE